MQRVILVTGATGHVGRHVVSQLLGADAAVRALVRNPDSVGLPGRVEVMRGDLSVPNTLDSCLYGVEAVFLVWPGLPIDFASAAGRSHYHVSRRHRAADRAVWAGVALPAV